MNGYIAFYNGARAEFHDETAYGAQKQAIAYWNVPKKKQHMVHVHLAEKNGEQVVHVADF